MPGTLSLILATLLNSRSCLVSLWGLLLAAVDEIGHGADAIQVASACPHEQTQMAG